MTFLSNVGEVKNRVLTLLHFRRSQFLKYGHLASVTQKFIHVEGGVLATGGVLSKIFF